jgi:hypothetical protein
MTQGDIIKRARVWLLLLLTPLACVEPSVADDASVPRVALVWVRSSESAHRCLDLVTAHLSADSKMHLVERTEIEKVLAERRLVVTLGDSEWTLRATKLWGAQFIAVLEMNANDSEPMAFTVFEASTTRRLVDMTLSPQVDEAAQQCAAGTRLALTHAADPAMGTLCVLSVRNVDLPATLDPLVDGLAALWERRLLGTGAITLLERKRLDQLNRERQISGQSAIDSVRKAILLADVQLSRAAEPGHAVMSIHLTDADGKALAVLKQAFDLARPGEVVQPLLDQAMAVIGSAPREPVLFDAGREALRFYAEAQRAVIGPNPDRGTPYAEAAYALEPIDCHLKMIAATLNWSAVRQLGGHYNMPWGHVHRLDDAHAARVLGPARRAMSIMHQVLERNPTPNLEQWGKVLLSETYQIPDTVTGILQGLSDVRTSPAVQDQINLYKQEVRAYQKLYIERMAALLESSPLWVVEQVPYVCKPLSLASGSLPEQDRALLGFWLPVVARLDREATSLLSPEQALALHQGLRWLHHPTPEVWAVNGMLCPPRLWPPDWAGGWAVLAPLVERLDQHSWLVLRWHARLMRELHAMRLSGPPPRANERQVDPTFIAEGRKRYLALSEDLQAWLKSPAARDPVTQVMGCMLWREAIVMLLFERDERVQQVTRLMAAMLDSRVVVVPVMHDMMSRFEDEAPQQRHHDSALQVVRALELMEQRQSVIQVGWDDSFERRALSFAANHAPGQMRTRALQVVESTRLMPEVPGLTNQVLDMHLIGPDLFVVAVVPPGEGWRCWRLPGESGSFGPAVPLGHLAASGPRPLTPVLSTNGETDAAIVADQTLFVATPRHGVLAFPMDGRPPWRIGAEQGLPSLRVTALASLDHTLFIGAGEGDGYLLSFDLRTSQWRTFASSRRSGSESPFDGNPRGFTIQHLLPEPGGRSFIVSVLCAQKRQPRVVSPLSGLWRLDADTGELRQLFNARGGHSLSWIEPGKTLWADGWWSSFTYDLATNCARLRRGHAITAAWLAENLGEGLKNQPVSVRYLRFTPGGFLIDDRHLFYGPPPGLFDLTSGRFMPLPDPRSDAQPGKGVTRLLQQSDDRLLLLYMNEIWQVRWRLPETTR